MSNRGGYRPGAGRPKLDLDEQAVRRELHNLLSEAAPTVARHLILAALGRVYVYRAPKQPRKGVRRPQKHELVTDPIEIGEALDCVSTGGIDPQGRYVYIVAEKPETRAANILLKRLWSLPDGKDKPKIKKVPFPLASVIKKSQAHWRKRDKELEKQKKREEAWKLAAAQKVIAPPKAFSLEEFLAGLGRKRAVLPIKEGEIVQVYDAETGRTTEGISSGRKDY